jgi:hypothetical protein
MGVGAAVTAEAEATAAARVASEEAIRRHAWQGATARRADGFFEIP